MRDRAPRAAQAVAQLLDRRHQRGKRGIGLRRQFLEARAIFRQHRFQRRAGMARLDSPEGGQLAKIQKWVVHDLQILPDAGLAPGRGGGAAANTYHAFFRKFQCMETTRAGLDIRSHKRRRRQRRAGLRAARGRIRRQGCCHRIASLGGHLRERGLRAQKSHVERGGRRLESRRRQRLRLRRRGGRERLGAAESQARCLCFAAERDLRAQSRGQGCGLHSRRGAFSSTSAPSR